MPGQDKETVGPRFSRTWTVEEHCQACDVLALITGLAKTRIKDCMAKGGVWLSKPGRSAVRLRRATTQVHAGDRLEINYDAQLLSLASPEPMLMQGTRRWSVWYKPAGMLSQGTRFADHCSLVRVAQTMLGSQRPLYLVHRLDREASGLLVLAHDQKSAAALSALVRQGLLEKEYHILVRGIPPWERLCVDNALDGKACCTQFQILHTHAKRQVALLLARLEQGRTHQIRRHAAMAGYPVLGDARYGQGRGQLQLVAVRLGFPCPFDRLWHEWTVSGPALA